MRKGVQHKYRLGVLFISLNYMTEWEELERFLVGLVGQITNNVTRGSQNAGQSLQIS